MIKEQRLEMVDISYQDVICEKCNQPMMRPQPMDNSHRYYCPICGAEEYVDFIATHYPRIAITLSNGKKIFSRCYTN